MTTPILITKSQILKIYKPISKTAHKGTQGHALLIGGSYGKIGSVCLSSKAALQSGCGLVTAFVPKCGYQIIQTAIPEVMVITAKKKKHIAKINFKMQPDAIGIGPGIGQKKRTKKAFHQFLKNNTIPLVIDADALNILSEYKKWLSLLAPKSILTPHPKELERLIGSFASEQEKFDAAFEFAKQYDLILVAKGAPTFIICEEKIYENTTGNQALATAGSGDTLTGIITSLLAQGYSQLESAMLGVYIHGLTADISIPQIGHEAFIARHIIDNLGNAFLSLHKANLKM